jgi:hypothetical protein
MFQVIVFERAIPFMSSKTAGLKPKPLPRDIVLLAPEET